MSSAWIKKHKPKKITDIWTHCAQVNIIINWLKSFEANKKLALSAADSKNKKKTSKKGRAKVVEKEEVKQPSVDIDDIEIPEDVCLDDVTEIEIVENYRSSKTKKKDVHRSSLVVTGKHGIGKSVCVDIIVEHMGYQCKRIDFTYVDMSRDTASLARQLLNTYDILDAFNSKVNKPYIIVIDALENITMISRRKVIEAMVKLNDVCWMCPIILISNAQHNKFINGIKDNSTVVYFNCPSSSDMMGLLCKICAKEKIIIDSIETAQLIITNCQKDYSRLLFVIEDIATKYKGIEITHDIIQSYFCCFKNKDNDIDIYTATCEIFTNFQEINKSLEFYEREKTLMPLMIQQNHFNCVNSFINVKSQESAISTHNAMLLSRGDVVENYIYGDQNWHLQKIHGFYTCAYPSHLISSNINTKAFRDHHRRPYVTLSFPNDLNRTSIKNINIKNIKNVKKYFPNMDTMDYVRLGTLLTKLINKGDMEAASNLIADYNVPTNIVVSVFKINKIDKTKTTIPTQMQKSIAQIVHR